MQLARSYWQLALCLALASTIGCGGGHVHENSPSSSVVDLNLAANDIAYDSGRGYLYVAVPASSPLYPSLVVQVKLSNGQVVSTLTPTSTPVLLAVSGDDSSLFVAESNGTVEQISISTNAILGTLPIPPSTAPLALTTVPQTQQSVAVTLVNSVDMVTDEGTYIYDKTLARPNSALLGQTVTFKPDGTEIYGYQSAAGTAHKYSVGKVSVTGIAAKPGSGTQLTASGVSIHYANGEILSDDGSVLSPETGGLLGTLTFPTTSARLGVAVPNSSYAYYATDAPSIALTYNLNNLSLVGQSELTNVTGTLTKAIYAGSGRIVITNGSAPGSSIEIISGLPAG